MALQQSGLPIWAQPGPAGGYFLTDAATLPPVNFTPSQAVAVSVALAALPSGSPFTVDGEAASRKIRDALGPMASEQTAGLASRVWVERPATEHPSAPPRVLRAVEQALADHRTLAMSYVSATGAMTRRTVEPILLAHAADSWYLVAHCQVRNATRWFQLDRIRRADLTKVRYSPRPVASVGAPPPAARPVDPPTSVSH